MTLGCPKNQVDSDKLEGLLHSKGFKESENLETADLLVVNTCAFIEVAREESIEAILELAARKAPNSKLAVTGCLAERYGSELKKEMPEIDVVAGFGEDFTTVLKPSGITAVNMPTRRIAKAGDIKLPKFDLEYLKRPKSREPWSYIKVAEGCDRKCGFCAIPSFRGKQRSRTLESVIQEVESLEIKEAVLVAQDLASYGRDIGIDDGINKLIVEVAGKVDWVRLLYLYPSSLNDRLIESVIGTGIPYFDLSLQHVSAPLVKKMRRYGSYEIFSKKIEKIRELEPNAVMRSSFLIGYPGETESDHDELLRFIEEMQLDWIGFFTFSAEEGTYALSLENTVPKSLARERLLEASLLQDSITARKREELVGSTIEVLVDSSSTGRSFREAPEIDGVVMINGISDFGSGSDLTIDSLPMPANPMVTPKDFVGEIFQVEVVSSMGPDLEAKVVSSRDEY